MTEVPAHTQISLLENDTLHLHCVPAKGTKDREENLANKRVSERANTE